MFLYNNYPAVRAEIGDIKNIGTNINKPECKFLNGSKIQAVPSTDNARGYRCNILILDEFRMIDKEVVDKVFKPMLNVMRQPPYLAKPEYKGYPEEENKQIYISSAWYKSHWIWGEFKRFLNGFLDHKDYFVLSIPWQLSVYHRLLDLKQVSEERDSDDFDEIGFQMEYEALFPSENDRGYFNLETILKARTLNRTFMPPTAMDFIENKNKSRTNQRNLSNMPRKNLDTERRIIALDIALMGGNKKVKNDSSAFTCMRLLQEGEQYRKEVVYLESITNSIESSDLAIRLKQLYFDFEADYVIVDTAGQGIGVFDALCKTLYDEERDEEYEPWMSMNDEAMNERIKAKGKPIIYSVKASASFNNDIAIQLRSALEKQRLVLPISDIVKREQLVADGGFLRMQPDEKQRNLAVYQAASALQSELVALEYTILGGGNIAIKEVGSATKDRYSSLAYCNWYANELEIELKSDEDTEWGDYFFISGGLER
ncbi:terminase [Enterococcus mundtii]|nr:terminase [Enterococcus mundtii]